MITWFFVLHSAFAQTDCSTRARALFDVGSGSTKLTLARVKICPQGTELVDILDDQQSLPVALEAAKDRSGRIPKEAQIAAVEAVKNLRSKALQLIQEKTPDLKDIEFGAAGTHAFRTARNKSELKRRIEALGIPMNEISHREEGRAGFAGVKIKGLPKACEGKSPYVWDIGGGSWELTGESSSLGGEAGAEAFKKKMIGLKKNPIAPTSCDFKESTPNPIGEVALKKGEAFSRAQARTALKKFKFDPEKNCLIGIGGVHVKAVEAQIQKQWESIAPCACPRTEAGCSHENGSYTPQELRCLANLLSSKDDCAAEIQGGYSTTAVSNLVLVLGYLEELRAPRVSTMNVNMGHALLTSGQIQFKRHAPAP